MLLKLLLLPLAVLLLALSLLTAVRVPVVVNWRLAVLAGEYGYLLAVLPLGLAASIWWSRQSAAWPWALAGCLVCAVAFGLLLKPVIEARLLGRSLPVRLSSAFGPARPDQPAFSLDRLFYRRPPVASVTTHKYAPGLQLDLRRPAGTAGPAPVVIVIHGGGWDGGDRNEVAGFNDWLVTQGWTVAAIDYRLAPEHPWPAQREDVRAAIAWLKEHGDELGLDANRLVLFGRSAGGQIAAAVGYGTRDPAIRGVIALYAPFDMEFAWSVSREDDALNSLNLMRQFLGGPPDDSRREVYRSASAQELVQAGRTPPTLLLHGSLDTLVWRRHSERLAARLAEAAVPHAFIELPWAVHAFEYNPHGPGGQLTTFACGWFLARLRDD